MFSRFLSKVRVIATALKISSKTLRGVANVMDMVAEQLQVFHATASQRSSAFAI